MLVVEGPLCWSINDPFTNYYDYNDDENENENDGDCDRNNEDKEDKVDNLDNSNIKFQYITRQCGNCSKQFLMHKEQLLQLQQQQEEDVTTTTTTPCNRQHHDHHVLHRLCKQQQPQQCECGLWYCTKSCQQHHYGANSGGGYHRLLCVGPVDELHPLYLYKVMALTTIQGPSNMSDPDPEPDDDSSDQEEDQNMEEVGEEEVDIVDYSYLYPTLMLALELVVVKYHQQQQQQRHLLRYCSPIILSAAERKEENYHKEEKEEESKDNDAFVTEIVNESYRLVQKVLSAQIIVENNNSNNNGNDDNHHQLKNKTPSTKNNQNNKDNDYAQFYYFSLLEWKQILQSIQKYRIEITIESPWSQLCKELAVVGTPSSSSTTAAATTTSENNNDDIELVKLILQQAKKEWNITSSNNDDDNDDDNANEENESSPSSSSSLFKVDIVHLMDEPDYYFPPIIISVLLKQQQQHFQFLQPQQFDENNDDEHEETKSHDGILLPLDSTFGMLEHSCLPSHQLTIRKSDTTTPINSNNTNDDGNGDAAQDEQKMMMIELQPIPKSQGGRVRQQQLQRDDEYGNDSSSDDSSDDDRLKIITVCRIDKELNSEERSEQLQQIYGTSCTCDRCIVEQSLEQQRQQKEQHEPTFGISDDVLNGIPDEVLAQMFELAKFQQRHDDALQLCDILLQRIQKKTKKQKHSQDHYFLQNYASILLDRARINGWKGNFEQREILLNEGATKMILLQQELQQQGSDSSSDNKKSNLMFDAKTTSSAPPAAAVDSITALHNELAELNAYYRTDWKDCCRDDDDDDDDNINHRPSSVLAADRYNMKMIPKLENRAYITENLLDAQECRFMIELAENYVQDKLGGNWTTSRHYAVPTTDFQIYQMPRILDWFNRQLQSKIYPILQGQFMSPPTKTDSTAPTTTTTTTTNLRRRQRLRMLDAFFVKYDAKKGQKRLPLHQDQSIYSLTIAMNPTNEYEGGGTYFADTGSSYTTDTGGMVSFHGELVHGGNAITSGIRYIIACFLYVEEEEEEEEEHDEDD